MEFSIRRTSTYWRKEPPCDEAVKKDSDWVVQINTLEDLVNFSHKYGQLILNEDFIEIYDDYRE